MNFLYINNFAYDYYGPGKFKNCLLYLQMIKIIFLGVGDCINVSWYMAIDMQFFVITPILLTLIWKYPKVGYSVIGILMTAGTACQIAFTIVDDEFFHGGFSYYEKPWNRSQPYFIGLLLGILLHKVKVKNVLRQMFTKLFTEER